jgi:hypothetical protein
MSSYDLLHESPALNPLYYNSDGFILLLTMINCTCNPAAIRVILRRGYDVTGVSHDWCLGDGAALTLLANKFPPYYCHTATSKKERRACISSSGVLWNV